jgi:DNA-dependent protein kinase catalytic subunit
MEGVYKQTMVHVLNALRKRKSVILDTCDIFVKEPLLDWISSARQRVIEQYGKDRVERDEELAQLSFYPKQKI